MALSKTNVGSTGLETPVQPAKTLPILREPVIPLEQNIGMSVNENGNNGFALNRNLIIVAVVLFFLLGMD